MAGEQHKRPRRVKRVRTNWPTSPGSCTRVHSLFCVLLCTVYRAEFSCSHPASPDTSETARAGRRSSPFCAAASPADRSGRTPVDIPRSFRELPVPLMNRPHARTASVNADDTACTGSGRRKRNHATAPLWATRWSINMTWRLHFPANLQWKSGYYYSLLLVSRLSAVAPFVLPTGWNSAADNRPPSLDSRGNQSKTAPDKRREDTLKTEHVCV